MSYITLKNYTSPQGIPCPNAVVSLVPGQNMQNPRGIFWGVWYDASTFSTGKAAMEGRCSQLNLSPSSTYDDAYKALLAVTKPNYFTSASLITS